MSTDKAMVTDAMVTAAHNKMMSELFLHCQPNRGDVFSFMDDRKDVVRAALSAALSEAEQQPVAWRYRFSGGKWTVQKNRPEWYRPDNADVELEPLYAHPPAKREAGEAAAPVQDVLVALQKISEEATVANDVIRLNRDGGGNGRVKVATAMHRIAEWAKAALATTEGSDNG